MTNLETFQHLYAAFGRGDIPTILNHLAEDVEWEYAATSAQVPRLQPHRGPREVRKFFEALGAFEFHTFQPKTLLESGNIVVALIDVELTVKATGVKIAEEDEVHIWHFNSEGQVSKFTHKVDTHQHWLAYKGGVTEEA